MFLWFSLIAAYLHSVGKAEYTINYDHCRWNRINSTTPDEGPTKPLSCKWNVSDLCDPTSAPTCEDCPWSICHFAGYSSESLLIDVFQVANVAFMVLNLLWMSAALKIAAAAAIILWYWEIHEGPIHHTRKASLAAFTHLGSAAKGCLTIPLAHIPLYFMDAINKRRQKKDKTCWDEFIVCITFPVMILYDK